MTIQDQIRRARERSGKTLVEVARLAGMHASNWLRVEKGEHFPEMRTLLRMAKALGKKLEVNLK
jgi:transcriptional regulator with XRE-family HTH domain